MSIAGCNGAHLEAQCWILGGGGEQIDPGGFLAIKSSQNGDPRLKDLVSKTKMESDRRNCPKSTSCLHKHIHICQRETERGWRDGGRNGRGRLDRLRCKDIKEVRAGLGYGSVVEDPEVISATITAKVNKQGLADAVRSEGRFKHVKQSKHGEDCILGRSNMSWLLLSPLGSESYLP